MHLSGVNFKNLTADGAIRGANESKIVQALCGVILTSGAGAAGTVVIYDGDDTNGTKIATVRAAAADTELALNSPIAINSGNVYADLSGANAEVTLLWK